MVLRGLRPAAYAIDYGERVIRHDIAAPRHVTVRAHQHQAALVELAYAGIGDRRDGERHAAVRESGIQRCAIRRAVAEPQQHKAAAEKIERGASVRHPRVWRPRAGTRGRKIFSDGMRGSRRAVAPTYR